MMILAEQSTTGLVPTSIQRASGNIYRSRTLIALMSLIQPASVTMPIMPSAHGSALLVIPGVARRSGWDMIKRPRLRSSSMVG